MDSHHQGGRRTDTKDLSYVYRSLSRTRCVVREYSQVFTFDNSVQYVDFNIEKELWRLMSMVVL